MNINLKRTDVTLLGDQEARFVGRLKELKKYMQGYEGVVQADFELGRSTHHHERGDVFFAKVSMQIPGRAQSLYAEASDESVEAAFFAMRDKLEQELRRNKDKRLDLRKRGASVKRKFKSFFLRKDS